MCNQSSTSKGKRQVVCLMPVIWILIVAIALELILNHTQAVSKAGSIATSYQNTQKIIPVFQPILNITASRG